MAEKENNPENEQKSGNKKGIIIAAIALLLILNGVLFYQFFSKNKDLESTKVELVESEELRSELENVIDDYKKNMKEMKGEMEGMDSLIDAQNKELEEKVAKIEALIRSERIAKADYQKAKKELDNLRYYKRKYEAKIDSMSAANKELKAQNESLKEEVAEGRKMKDELKDENAKLSNKVSLGSKLEAANFKVTGINVRRNRESETMNVRRMDHLNICIKFKENVIADKGEMTVYIKINNFKGETIGEDISGSGKFKLDGSESLYTFKETIDFQNTQKEHCLKWDKDYEFQPEYYTIEMYTKDYQIATKRVEFKSGLF